MVERMRSDEFDPYILAAMQGAPPKSQQEAARPQQASALIPPVARPAPVGAPPRSAPWTPPPQLAAYWEHSGLNDLPARNDIPPVHYQGSDTRTTPGGFSAGGGGGVNNTALHEAENIVHRNNHRALRQHNPVAAAEYANMYSTGDGNNNDPGDMGNDPGGSSNDGGEGNGGNGP